MESQEAELHRLHHDLRTGLNTLRRIRTLYDEKIAFNFDSLSFFCPNENTTSDILEFFLNPDRTHGQKLSFLKAFLQYFDVDDAPTPTDTNVHVTREKPTRHNRRIDIVIEFFQGNSLVFAIGLENKIHDGTADQVGQLRDYAKDLEDATNGNYVLFYLTPDGRGPAEHSIDPSEITELGFKFQCISYTGEHGIINLLSRFEQVCLADNVRAFIRQFQQHLRHEHVGVTDMGEQDYITEFVRNNPDILQYLPALDAAVTSLRKQYLDLFLNQLRERLKPIITLDGRHPTRSYEYFIVRSDGLTLHDPVDEVRLCHDGDGFWLCLRLRADWNSLSADLTHRVDGWGSKLRERPHEFPPVTPDWNYERCRIALPYFKIHTHELLCKVIQDEDGNRLESAAQEAERIIRGYVEVLTGACHDTSSAHK